MGNNNEITASSLEAMNRHYEMITHNLANANTIGFKRTRTLFEQAMKRQGGKGPGSGLGIDAKSHTDFLPGTTVKTDRPLDLTLSGNGFFTLESTKGTVYTRNGTFNLNSQGQLVDTAGRLVAGENGPIVVPKSVGIEKIKVAADGTIEADGKAIGKLKIVDFVNLQRLKPAGSSAFSAPSTLETKPAGATVYQGYQESSNVSVVEELANLIAVTRMYEANLKTVNVDDDRLKTILQVAMM